MKTYFVIIIPCKGYNEYLNKTIKGCLNQTFKDFKIYLLPDNDFENDIYEIYKKSDSCLELPTAIYTAQDIKEVIGYKKDYQGFL